MYFCHARPKDACSIAFEYQAEKFSIYIEEDSRFITLYDVYWYSFDANDIEQLSAVKKAVNEINWQSQVNVCYNKTAETNQFNVHTRTSFICIPNGDFTDYLRHILRECFVVHHHFYKLLSEAHLTKEA